MLFCGAFVPGKTRHEGTKDKTDCAPKLALLVWACLSTKDLSITMSGYNEPDWVNAQPETTATTTVEANIGPAVTAAPA